MNPFRYERARDPYSAVTLLAGAPNGVFLAGGTNLVDHLKLGVREPDLLVDITHLPYDRIEPLPDGGIRIGAMVRNTDLAGGWHERPLVLLRAIPDGVQRTQ